MKAFELIKKEFKEYWIYYLGLIIVVLSLIFTGKVSLFLIIVSLILFIFMIRDLIKSKRKS